MSYILEALRKSEQERQIASGRGAGMLYPVLVELPPKSRLKPLLFAGTASIAVIVATSWWFWPILSGMPNANPVEKIVVPVIPQPVSSLPEPAQTVRSGPPVGPLQTSKPVIAEGVPPVSEKALVSEPVALPSEKSGAVPVPKKSSLPAIKEVKPEQPVATVTNKPDQGIDALPKGLPPLIISGFINDEQGANLAIINDKLVHEGEEVAPGLRLEKVIDESAIFSYKGQRFRR